MRRDPCYDQLGLQWYLFKKVDYCPSYVFGLKYAEVLVPGKGVECGETDFAATHFLVPASVTNRQAPRTP